MQRISNSKFNRASICILYSLCCLMMISAILEKDTIYSMLFMLSFVIVLFMFLTNIDKYSKSYLLLLFALICLTLFNVLINALCSDNAKLSLNYLKKYIMFIASMIFLSLCSKVKIDSKTKKFIGGATVILSCLIILFYFLLGNTLYRYNGIQSKYLVFNFGNPNAAGMYLTAVALIELSVFYNVGIFKKIIVLGIGAFLCYLVTLTQCRNAELAILIFFIIQIIYRVRSSVSKNKKIPRWLIVLVAIIPILFAVVYMALIDNPAVANALKFMSSEGKGIDSRERIWTRAFAAFGNSPIFGAYSEISGGSGASQMHNSHVDVLVSYGIVPFIVMIIILSKIMLETNKKINSPKQQIYYIAFMCIVFIGCCEAVLFSGGILYIFAGCMLLCSSYSETCEVQCTNDKMLFDKKCCYVANRY